MCNLNDTVGNMEQYELVPFQVHLHQFLAEPCWDLFPFPCHLPLLPSDCMHTSPGAHRGAQPAAAHNSSSPLALLQVYILHPIHHSTCFTGAQENLGSDLFNQLLLLPPLISSTITLAANEFTHTHLKHIKGGSSSGCHIKKYKLSTAINVLNEKSILGLHNCHFPQKSILGLHNCLFGFPIVHCRLKV